MIKNFKPKENNCRNCKYFREHYFKSRGGYFSTNMGLCVHKKIKCKIEDSINHICDFWVLYEELPIEYKKDFKKTIYKMCATLVMIESYLSDENEKPKNSN